MSSILEKFKARETQKITIEPKQQEQIQTVMQMNTVPLEPEAPAEEIITADQVMDNETVILDGVKSVCKGRMADGRIAFMKEGNSRSTLVGGEKQVTVHKAEEQTVSVPVTAVIIEQPVQPTVIPPVTASVPAVQTKAVAVPFEGFLTPEMVRELFKGDEKLIAEALEEDELPEGNITWPEIIMKECMLSNGQSRMLFAVERGKGNVTFPFKGGDSFSGYIIFQHSAKACYDKDSKPGDKKLPLCYSEDGKKPFGGKFFARNCKECPYDEFGSSFKGGKGKACSDRLKTFIYVPELKDVFLFDVSPMSIRAITNYLNNLASNNPPINYKQIVTVVTCKGVYDGSSPYGVIDVIRPEPIADIEDFKTAVERRFQLKTLMTPAEAPVHPLDRNGGNDSTAQVSSL